MTPSEPVTLRTATPADATAIAQLHADSWQRTYRGMMSDSYLDGECLDDRMRVWRERFAAPAANQIVVVAPGAAQIDGFVCAYVDDDPRWGSLIDNLHVRHTARKRGIGRLLMREAAARCEERRPGGSLYLYVLQANVEAQHFYDRLGGINAETLDVESHDGGVARSFRYAWPSASTLLSS